MAYVTCPTSQAPVNVFQRNNMAQLCKGFLLLNDHDEERAKMFLVAFLTELKQA
jgi:hypothetical protein